MLPNRAPGTTRLVPSPEVAYGSYLGCQLVITKHAIEIHDRDGHRLGQVTEFSAARRFIRGYRRGPKTQRPPLQLGSERDGLRANGG